MDLGIEGLGPAVRIGAGASATVYRASQERLNREVAVKVLADTESAFVRRFEREARTLGRLSQNPGIVTVHDSGVTRSGEPYLLMELCPGSLLHRLRSEGRLDPFEASRLIADVAEALATAHGQGIVHRDLKPDNILLSPTGEPLIADFGIATAVGQAGGQTSSVGFTPGYVAPETVSGQLPGPPADVYALAATLFHLVSGRPPFVDGQNDTNLLALAARVTSDPVPDLRPQGVPPDVCLAIESGLAKDPTLRPSAAEFASGLRALAVPDASAGSAGFRPQADQTADQTHVAMPANSVGVGPGSVSSQDPLTRVHDAPRGSQPGAAGPNRTAGFAIALGALLVVVAAAGALVLANGGNADTDGGGGVEDTTVIDSVASPDLEAPGSTSADFVDERSREVEVTVSPQLGASTFEDDYSAEVVALEVQGHELVVSFDAAGPRNLRQPETSCLRNESTDAVAQVVRSELTTDQAGRYVGDLTFPVLQDGRWSFQYSCQDYSLVPVAQVQAGEVRLSRFDEEYYALVVGYRRTETQLVVDFVAHGDSNLRAPASSCVVDGQAAEYPAASVDLSIEQAGYFVGSLTFEVEPAEVSFVYSCTGDYSAVILE